jgi:hypothetical protein
MQIMIDTVGQSLPTDVRSAITESSALFKEGCVVSVLDDPTTDIWQLKVRSERYTRVLNLDARHQTVEGVKLALQKIQASFTDHCHSCFNSSYLLKCQGNETKTCEDWVCPKHNENLRSQNKNPLCSGCWVLPFPGIFVG